MVDKSNLSDMHPVTLSLTKVSQVNTVLTRVGIFCRVMEKKLYSKEKPSWQKLFSRPVSAFSA